MIKFVLLFVGVYGALYAHKSLTASSGRDTEGAGAFSVFEGVTSSRERLRQELAKEKESPGALTKSFEQVVSQINDSRSETASGADRGEDFEFLREVGESQEEFYARVADYANQEESQNYWTLKSLVQFSLDQKVRDQNDLIRIALTVFDSYDALSEEMRSDELYELVTMSADLLERQISNPHEKKRIYEELAKRGHFKIEQ